MTSRTVLASFARELNRQHSAEAILPFVTITHPEVSEPLRFVGMPRVNHVIGADTYYGIGFEWTLLTDDDRPPRSEITLSAVDRKSTQYVRDLKTPPRLRLDLRLSSEFDESAIPRVAIGSPTPHYTADFLFVTDVTYQSMSLRGRLESWDHRQTTFPSKRATKARCPGLHR